MDWYQVPGTDWRMATGRVDGQGPLLVYLHGLGCAGSRDWPPVAGAPALAGQASLWVDLLGFGQSDRPEAFSYDLGEQANLLAGLLAGESGPVVLVGHSMGGTLAVILAERLIERGRPPAAVVVAEPNLRPDDAGMSARAATKSPERFIAAWPRWVESFPSPHYQENMRLASPLAFHRSAVSLRRHGSTMLERLVNLPVERGYILGARSDEPTQETARLTAAAGVPVVAVPGSGHGFSEDDPAGFALAIAQLVQPILRK